jgi:hypothetical protein
MDGYRTMSENAGSKISCQDISPPKGFEMKSRSKPRVRPVDYHLACCIVARFRKTTKYPAFKLSCQSPHLAKIYEMRSISKALIIMGRPYAL